MRRRTVAISYVALAAMSGCAGVEQWPGISTGLLGAVAVSGGVFAMSEGEVLGGIGLTALGVGLGIVAFSYLDESLAEVPRLERRAVAVALSRGDGALVTDLAGDLDLSESVLKHLGHVLRTARRPLFEAMPISTDGSWRPFFSALRSVIAKDAVLAPGLDRLDARIRSHTTRNSHKSEHAATQLSAHEHHVRIQIRVTADASDQSPVPIPLR